MRLLGEDVTDQVQAADDRDTELTATDRAARERADRRRPNFNFKEMGIEPGAVLRFRDDDTVTVEVVDEKLVRMGDEELEASGSLCLNVLAPRPRRCIAVGGFHDTLRLMADAGCEVTRFNADALCIPCEGGPTCMTLPLWRGQGRVNANRH